MTTDLTLYLRNPSLQREGQIDDFDSCTLNPRWNDVGKWVLQMDRRAPLAAQLMIPGWASRRCATEPPCSPGCCLTGTASSA